jgi:hypothetical protein
MLAQQDPAPKWLVYFDPDSPDWLKRWIEKVRGPFEPLFRSGVPREDLVADLAALFPTKSEALITTNLDNDDGLAVDFGRRLQQLAPLREREAVYFSHGLIRTAHSLYLRTDRSNAFCTVREGWDDPKTAWFDWHNRLGLAMPVRVVGGPPAWLQVVHSTNVSNRVRGRLVSPEPYRGRFVALDDLPTPTRGDVLIDRGWHVPVRVTRDSMRTVARKGAVRLLGKDRFTSMKTRLPRQRAGE